MCLLFSLDDRLQLSSLPGLLKTPWSGEGGRVEEMKVEMTLFLGCPEAQALEASVGVLGQEHPSPPVSAQAARRGDALRGDARRGDLACCSCADFHRW